MASSGRKQVHLDDIWVTLEAGVEQIVKRLHDGCSTEKWMSLYSNVYDFCTAPPPAASASGKSGRSRKEKQPDGASLVGSELYYRLEDYLRYHLRDVLAQADGKMGEDLLVYYNREWERYTTALRFVNKIFMYLNRHWVKRERDEGLKDVYEVYPLSLVVWRDTLFTPLKGRILTALLRLVEKERSGELVNGTLLQGIITKSYVELGLDQAKPDEPTLLLYQSEFEDGFLEQTELFYSTESTQFLEKHTIPEYLAKIEARLEEEAARVTAYLHPSTETTLIARCEQVLITRPIERIWGEFKGLLINDKQEDLSRMFRLLNRVTEGLEPLKDVLERHITTAGQEAVQALSVSSTPDSAQVKEYVDTLLGVYHQFAKLVETAFQNDAGFVASLDKACRAFVNTNSVAKPVAKTPSRTPELLARYCDSLLKKSNRNPEDAEMEAALNDVMVVFKYVEDKDVFQRFYSKRLAKRLINSTSASEDAEGQMISKMKGLCGYEYTTKLQRMFTDRTTSRDLTEKFREHCHKNDKLTDGGLDFTVMVMATGSWPLQRPTTNFVTPPQLEAYESEFVTFYTEAHNGRRLYWLHQLSKGEMRAWIGPDTKKSYVVQASTYQIAILLLFNTHAENTVKTMKLATDLAPDVLNNTLTSLIKTKVLVCDAPDGKFADATVFRVNPEFKSNRVRIAINIPIAQEVKKEHSSTMKTVEEDRKLQLQAAIVRVMKTRKSLSHTKLIQEVIVQVKDRFTPTIAAIKRSIDILIEKDYIERSSTDKDTFLYIA